MNHFGLKRMHNLWCHLVMPRSTMFQRAAFRCVADDRSSTRAFETMEAQMNSSFFEPSDGVVVSHHAVYANGKTATAGSKRREQHRSSRTVGVVREVVDQEVPDHHQIDRGQRSATALAMVSQRFGSTGLVQSPPIFIQLPTMNPCAWG